jgi:hypothetical protein
MKLYRQLRVLRLRLKKLQTPEEEKIGLDTLANLATTIMDALEPSTQPTKIRRSARIKTIASEKV